MKGVIWPKCLKFTAKEDNNHNELFQVAYSDYSGVEVRVSDS